MSKHTTAELRQLVPKMREKGFYLPQKQRKIDWSAYTTNQIRDIIDTLHFIRNEVDKVHTPRQTRSVGRPPTDEGILAKIILFVELFHIPERKAEGWVLIIGPHLGINQQIDDRVIGKAYQNASVTCILHNVFKNNISTDGNMGGDGTGLERSRKQNYESTKSKEGTYMTSIVDSREIVLAFDIGTEQECRAMHGLVVEIKECLKKDINKILAKAKLTLDAGFVDRKLSQLIEDSGMIPYIFPKTNTTINSRGTRAWTRMFNELVEDVQAWLKEYHIRSHTESFHSSFKRVFGIVTKMRTTAIYTQVLCRIVHNNRRKTEYFAMAQIA